MLHAEQPLPISQKAKHLESHVTPICIRCINQPCARRPQSFQNELRPVSESCPHLAEPRMETVGRVMVEGPLATDVGTSPTCFPRSDHRVVHDHADDWGPHFSSQHQLLHKGHRRVPGDLLQLRVWGPAGIRGRPLQLLTAEGSQRQGKAFEGPACDLSAGPTCWSVEMTRTRFLPHRGLLCSSDSHLHSGGGT